MAYTTINKSTDHFNSKLYTGNGTTDHAITGVGFQPDLNWIKERSNADNHILHYVGMNAGDYLRSNTNDALSNSGEMTKSLDSDGFTVGTRGEVNTNSSNYASWNWKAGGSGSANTDGTISSTVSANTTAGFSIVSYTGNGTSGATVGHGLGAVPKLMIVKCLTGESWQVYHVVTGYGYTSELNITNAPFTTTNRWNSTDPTSSVFTLGNSTTVNANGTAYIAYIFAEKQGYSRITSYKGNGNADGTFVYTGFKPAFILAKNTSRAENWTIWDSARGSINVVQRFLRPDESTAETNSSTYAVDILSNGFKWRAGDTKINHTGDTYMYWAFGQSLVGSNNVPCTAR
jgi:hypothetical protein